MSSDEFRQEAVKQVTERGHKVADVAARLGVSTYSLYDWIRRYGPSSSEYQAEHDQQAEIKRLQSTCARTWTSAPSGTMRHD